MVARKWIFWGVVALYAAASFGVRSVQAQFVRGRVGGGVVVRAPFVPRIVVGPRPIVRPVVPLVRPVAPLVRSAIPLVVPRRVVGGAVVARAPLARGVAQVGVAAPNFTGVQVFASPVAPASASSAVSAPATAPTRASEPLYPTAEELRSVDDGELLNTLLDVTGRLDADLARFTTGAQWRTYLQLPADAVPAPTNNQVVLGMSSLKATLARFDKIAADSAYRTISGLGSFVASHAALAEAVARFEARQAPQTPPQTPRPLPIPPQTSPRIPPQSQTSSPSGVVPASANEELPSPAPAGSAPQAESSGGERSILSR